MSWDETRDKQFQKAIVDPELQARTEEASSNYLQKGHYNSMLEKLCSECEASEKYPESKVENATIKNLGHWL
jgi:hypothetical protein